MALEGRKIAITGAGRGLGRALAVIAADRGAVPILLGRSLPALQEVARIIEQRAAIRSAAYRCDLADLASVAAAAAALVAEYPDLDALVHNGARWSGGTLATQDDASIAAVVSSTITGTMALTRQLLPVLRAHPFADIHFVVSMSALAGTHPVGASLPFRAAKAAQQSFAQNLAAELNGTPIRVTSIYPGLIDDVSPTAPEWDAPRGISQGLSNRDVVDAMLYALSAPPNVSLRQIVIERTRSDFL